MELPASGDDGPRHLSSILADPRQRRLISVLLDASHPMTDRDLAVRIGALEGDTAPSDVSGEKVRRVLLDIHHRCLPKLETVGWVDRLPAGVVTTEEFPFEDDDSDRPPLLDERRWELLTPLLVRPRRRHVVAILARREGPLDLDELAAQLRECEQFDRTTGGDGESLPHSAILHHVDLPRLAEAGLVGYDPDGKTIAPGRDLAEILDWIEVDDAGEEDSLVC